MVAVFNLERSRGPTFLGTPHHPILSKIPTHVLVSPNAEQAPMPPYGQIRSRTSGFRWSYLCETPLCPKNQHFPVFQGGPGKAHHPAICYSLKDASDTPGRDVICCKEAGIRQERPCRVRQGCVHTKLTGYRCVRGTVAQKLYGHD